MKDLTQEEITARIKEKYPVFSNEEGLEDSILIASYWIAHDYHDGMWSNLYKLMCQSPYKPGPLKSCIEDEEDDLAVLLYDIIREEFKQNEQSGIS